MMKLRQKAQGRKGKIADSSKIGFWTSLAPQGASNHLDSLCASTAENGRRTNRNRGWEWMGRGGKNWEQKVEDKVLIYIMSYFIVLIDVF